MRIRPRLTRLIRSFGHIQNLIIEIRLCIGPAEAERLQRQARAAEYYITMLKTGQTRSYIGELSRQALARLKQITDPEPARRITAGCRNAIVL